MLNIPVLSIIVPSYNMEKYLPKCLGSLVVAPELMDRLEVLVVNDGSKDRTSEIAHDFASKWPRTFKVIDKPNGNYGSCINAALPLATGVFVKVLDADDWFDTDAFEQFIKRLIDLQDPLPDLVLTDYDEVDEDGEILRHIVMPYAEGVRFTVSEFLAKWQGVQMHAIAYRTDLLRAMAYKQLEGVSYTDTEWAVLPISAVETAVRFPEVVYKYLVGRAGQTMDLSKRVVSWWMRGAVALDMARKFVSVSGECEQSVRDSLFRRIESELEDTYRVAIFGMHGHKANIDLDDFDRQVRSVSPMLYDKLNTAVYSRKLPYCYIKAWRERSVRRYVMLPLCKAYTKLAMTVKKWVH